MDLDGEYIHRFDTSINGIDLPKRLISTNHNALGYFTVKSPDKYESGTWSVVHDYGSSTGWDNISWNSWEPVGTKVSVHVRSSNDQINWSNWEDAGNGLSLKMTPPGRYLQVEVNLERFNNTESPVVYDISVNALNTSDEATDLAVNITGNASSVGIGDTVHLIISLSNLGPKSCDAKLNYKIPVGLKLLSSQGPGAYDVASGVWDAGLLSVNDSVSLDLVLQVLGAGCFNHVVDVFDNLNISNNHMVWSMVCASVLGHVTPMVISSSVFDGLKPIDNGNGGSGSGSGNGGSGNGGNGGNGGGSGGAGGSGNGGNDQNDNQKPDEKPKPGVNKGNDQLYRDQMYVRDYVGYVGSNNHDGSNDQGGSDSQIPSMPDWTLQPPGSEDDKVENGEIPSWVYMALAAGIIIAAVAIKKPEWGTAILNGLRTLWNTMRYFGGSTKLFVDTVLKPNVKNIFKLTGAEDSFNSFSAILDGLNPNVGSTVVKWVLKNGLNRIVSKIAPDFAPSIESSMGMVIDVVFSGINLAELANDPLGKVENIINIFNPYHGDKQDDYEGLTDPRPFG